jgi:DNA (cytosine-5)-methyltransferase 1
VIENVVGINRAFLSKGGVKPPFVQLREALVKAGKGYVVQPVEVNARHFGVAQNRPRMMLIGLRKDRAAGVRRSGGLLVSDEPWRSVDAWCAAQNACDPTGGLTLVPQIGSRIEGDQPLVEHTVEDAIWDLDDFGYSIKTSNSKYRRASGRYARQLRGREEVPTNHVLRNHGERATERFDLYHYMADEGLDTSVLAIAKHEPNERIARAVIVERLQDNGLGLPSDRLFVRDGDQDLVDVIVRLATKKHTQRVVSAKSPAPTVVTLPDDYVHPWLPRIMTVRELARFQSFPDWFEFRSKETTGSERRKFEVPQYSQVGNAVPPLLARAIGERLKELLS